MLWDSYSGKTKFHDYHDASEPSLHNMGQLTSWMQRLPQKNKLQQHCDSVELDLEYDTSTTILW